MKKHSKHTKLTLRKNGEFSPSEISFVGVKCSVISKLVAGLSHELCGRFKIAYADASHGEDNKAPVFDTFTYHASGDMLISSDIKKNTFNEHIRFSNYDVVFVNGNHFSAQKQVVILDPEKESSVEKRITQLDAVQFFIRTHNSVEVFECLKEKYPNYTDLPVYDLEDLNAIKSHVLRLMEHETPKLNGLVLVGGKSIRMGVDKAQLVYHGIPQSDFSVQLLEKKGLQTFVSVRESQKIEKHKTITDVFLGLGPFGAICSAFRKNPNEAYLVLATDLPYVSDEVIDMLILQRNPKKIATAIKGKSSKFMEPLIAIWEPKSYPVLLSYLAQGYSCPRKILINSDVELIEVEDTLIRNVNTREEFEAVKIELNTIK
jgi:molybdopterin-guanine dinucleotide biosynthesis protein A